MKLSSYRSLHLLGVVWGCRIVLLVICPYWFKSMLRFGVVMVLTIIRSIFFLSLEDKSGHFSFLIGNCIPWFPKAHMRTLTTKKIGFNNKETMLSYPFFCSISSDSQRGFGHVMALIFDYGLRLENSLQAKRGKEN